jgi:hypothetical protein
MLLSLIFVFLLVIGCVSHKRETAQTAEEKEVLTTMGVLSTDEIKDPYIIVGSVRVRADEGEPLPEIISRLREKADELKGDALVDLKKRRIPAEFPGITNLFYVGRFENFWSAKVIKWKTGKEGTVK